MNKQRRKLLQEAIAKLDHAQSDVFTASDEEQEYVDNMPENLQESDRYYTAENTANELSEVADEIAELIGRL
jgi:hypothetical protein